MSAPIAPLPIKTLRLVAAEAEVDERTATRVLLGLPTRPVCRERVAQALDKRGIDIATLVPGIDPEAETTPAPSPKPSDYIAVRGVE